MLAMIVEGALVAGAVLLAAHAAWRYGRDSEWRGRPISWAHLQTVRLEQHAAECNEQFVRSAQVQGERLGLVSPSA